MNVFFFDAQPQADAFQPAVGMGILPPGHAGGGIVRNKYRDNSQAFIFAVDAAIVNGRGIPGI
ncbi:MAG: hypothetical protein GTO45_35530 [Candidatus Aminicenantes bacterium]|nr:hypothetical protein [Candidatus Aminicenantes bacterium]NIM83988.1 hypothetical protein [Candidatus Aminicenantes bacterium]NIN23466.1 hypothetical protein [Candidatus Aminicenantes bacterium]NIN47171.1 hypothetical protein [Candidatus Aminicenantes bacterium]NIN90095.1 hypothetical protein [Candidatus Aminicenantes bacterium]